MEREIGERFYINDKQYEIIEEKSDACKKCCFYNIDCLELIKNHIGFCSKIFRTDNKNINVKIVNN